MRNNIFYGAGLYLATSLTLCGSEAPMASSLVPIGAGARALGMGGAFSAVADDATALSWNPAGMTQLERPEVATSFGYYQHNIDGKNDNGGMELDHISVVYPFYAGEMMQTVGISWQRQFDLGMSYEATASTVDASAAPFVTATVDTTEVVQQDGGISSLSIAYAIEVEPTLSLGVALNIWNDDFTKGSSFSQRKKVTTRVRTDFPTLPFLNTDITSKDTVTRDYDVEDGYSATISARWQVMPALALSCIWKPAYTLNIDTSISQLSQVTGNPDVQKNLTEKHETTYPDSITIGTAWRQNDTQTFSLDINWVDWSNYLFRKEDSTGTVDRFHILNSQIDADDVKDGYTIRAGYEHVFILPSLVTVLRTGFLYEQLPGLSPALSLDTPETVEASVDEYYGITIGASIFRRDWLYDASVQYRWGNDVGTGSLTSIDNEIDIEDITIRAGITFHF